MKRLLIVFFSLLVVAMPSFAAGKQQDLSALLQNAREGIALVSKGLKEAKVNTKAKAVTPFAKSLKALHHSLKKAEAQLKRKDKTISKTLSLSAREARTLEVTYSRSGITNENVKKGVVAANQAVLVAAREVLGGGVKKAGKDKATLEKSKAEYVKLQTNQKSLAEKLGALRNQIKGKKDVDPVFTKTVDRLYAESQKVSKTAFSADALADAILLAADIAGIFDGWTYYIDPIYVTYWTPLVTTIDYTEVWLETVWDVAPYDIAYYELAIEVPSDYQEIEIAEAELGSYEDYTETVYEGSDFDVDSEDVGDFANEDVSGGEAEYLEDEEVDSAMEEDTSREVDGAEEEANSTDDAEDIGSGTEDSSIDDMNDGGDTGADSAVDAPASEDDSAGEGAASEDMGGEGEEE